MIDLIGGAGEDRTHDLLNAIQARRFLSVLLVSEVAEKYRLAVPLILPASAIFVSIDCKIDCTHAGAGCKMRQRNAALTHLRGVAQSGSAPTLGAGGRWFESSSPDQPFTETPRTPPLTETAAGLRR